MKRSEINEILGHTRQFFSMHDVHLPPFASFPPTRWQQLDPNAWQEVFDLRLGWDVTAFGGDNFAAQGLTLFALRNGSPGGKPWAKCYAEKIMHVREGQVTPPALSLAQTRGHHQPRRRESDRRAVEHRRR